MTVASSTVIDDIPRVADIIPYDSPGPCMTAVVEESLKQDTNHRYTATEEINLNKHTHKNLQNCYFSYYVLYNQCQKLKIVSIIGNPLMAGQNNQRSADYNNKNLIIYILRVRLHRAFKRLE